MAYVYYLSYKKPSYKKKDMNEIEDVDLSKLDCTRGYLFDTLDFIDTFTSKFPNKEVLLTFLKKNNIIDKRVNDLFITMKRETKDRNENVISSKNMGVIFEGNSLMFENDYNLLNGEFVIKWIEQHKKSPIIRTLKNFYNTKAMDNIPANLRDMLIDIIIRINIIESNEVLSSDIDSKATTAIENLKKIYYKKTEKKESYREIHDLIIFIKKYDKDLDLYRKILGNSKNKFKIYNNGDYPSDEKEYEFGDKDEHEEFITQEDLESLKKTKRRM